MDFDCGRGSELSDWLNNKALSYQNERLCSTWLLVTEDDSEAVRGFFTLSAHTITVAEIHRKNRADDSINGSIVSSLPQLPAHLLGKFAVDSSLQGTNVGKLLMMHVFRKFVEAGRVSGSKYLVLDTREKDLVRYYRSQYGFIESPTPDPDGLFRMYKKAIDVEDDLDQVDALLRGSNVK